MPTDTGIAPSPGEASANLDEIKAEQEQANELAGEKLDDPGAAVAGEAQPPPGSLAETERTEPKPLRRITPQDEARAAIAARFKERRAAGGGHLDFHGDHRDPTQTYGEVAAPGVRADEPLSAVAHLPEPGVPSHATAGDRGKTTEDRGDAAGPDPSPKAAPVQAGVRPPSSEPQRLFRAKVNGTEVLLTEEQMVAEAQKSLAAGDVLGLAKTIYRGARQEASAAPNQGDDDPARSPRMQPRPTRSPNQETGIDELIQDLQFGDPAEVAPKLEKTIESKAQAAAREAVLRTQVESEVAHSKRILAKFEQDNADLARDEFARDVIERQVYREYGKDLAALGIPPDQIPSDPLTRASWHNQLRATGGRVRDIGDILTSARDEFVKWRGGPRPQPSRPQGLAGPAGLAGQPAASRPAAPRIEVSVNRDDRRQAIPTQPTRASVPPNAPAAIPQPRDRSDVIREMRKARHQIVAS